MEDIGSKIVCLGTNTRIHTHTYANTPLHTRIIMTHFIYCILTSNLITQEKVFIKDTYHQLQ